MAVHCRGASSFMAVLWLTLSVPVCCVPHVKWSLATVEKDARSCEHDSAETSALSPPSGIALVALHLSNCSDRLALRVATASIRGRLMFVIDTPNAAEGSFLLRPPARTRPPVLEVTSPSGSAVGINSLLRV